MLFKILHGDKARISTDITPYHEGYCYVTHDGYFYVDMNNERVKLSAKEAESLTGYDIVTILNSSDIEIPTSKAIKTYVDNAVANAGSKVELDTTLTQSGKAADAKAVGDALAGKAKTADIPTKVSDLTNDSGFITSYTETDPTVPAWAKAATKPNYTASEIGANGVAELDASGKIITSQLPSYVDDVLEYSTKSSFPATGETGKIYVDTGANKTYRWGGSAYVEISASLALGITSSTAYRGDRGNTAYAHSQTTSGNPHGVTKSEVGLGNVDNVKQYSASNPPPYPVTKVNNKTGAVALSASDVGADPSGTASSAVSAHNTSTSAHADIREQISQLSSEIVDEIIVMTQDAYNALTKSDLQALYAQGVRLIAVETSSGTVTYTNLVPTSTDTDGSIYNGTGYKDGVRLSSSGGVSSETQPSATTTGFIPFKNTDIIRVKGVITLGAWDNYGAHCYFNLYDSNKTFVSGGCTGIGSAFDSNMASQLSFTYDETTGITTLQIIDPDGDTGSFRAAAKQASYFRLNAVGKGANLIITVNEEI